MADGTDVIVIGGGVIGLACADALLDAGRSVVLLERARVGSGASQGNCGLVTPGHSLPLTQPGMLRKVLGWMLRADSPVLVRPRLDWSFLTWALCFARNCREDRMLAAFRGRAALLEMSRALYDDALERSGLDCEWQAEGVLEVFATAAAMEAAQPVVKLLAEHGIEVDVLGAQRLQEIEPALRDDVRGAHWHRRDAQLRPERLVAELTRVVRAKGAEVREDCAVFGFAVGDGLARAVATSRGAVRGEHFVVAGGAWSPQLGRMLGVRLPVQPGKGYSITVPRPEPCPTRPLLLHEAKIGVTPWASSYRLGGTMEFAGYDDRLRRPRLAALSAGAGRYLRHPPVDIAEEWCGFRPMTPDDLPIIDRVPRIRNVVLATGHGMMGISMAPGTGRVVADLITGRDPPLDVTPYAVCRFK